MLKYLKDHILEEIEGSIDYLEKAIELKSTQHSNAAAKFYRMSEMEIEHANCMTKMLGEFKMDNDSSDSEAKELYSGILEAYSNSMAKIEALKKLYRS